MLVKGLVFCLFSFSVAEDFAYTPKVDFGLTLTSQAASDRRLRSEANASLDVYLTWKAADSSWFAYFEGISQQRSNSISALLVTSNADIGRSENQHSSGHLQLSELKYERSLSDHYDDNSSQLNYTSNVVLGLIDPTAYLDTSWYSNDETKQFLASSLVNNPTIDFTDYALAFVYQRDYKQSANLTFLLSSSHGLADNPGVDYSQLLDIDNQGKGFFSAFETAWLYRVSDLSKSRLAIGVWYHSADHTALDDATSSDLHNYGAYFVFSKQYYNHGLEMRFGLANPKVSQGDSFFSLAYLLQRGKVTYAAACSLTTLSDKVQASNLADSSLFEAYVKHQIKKNVSLAFHFQHIRNGLFDNSSASYNRKLSIWGVRAQVDY